MTAFKRLGCAVVVAVFALVFVIAPAPASAGHLAGHRDWSLGHHHTLGINYVNQGDQVGFWQGFLRSYGTIPCGGVDGLFGSQTATATQSIQSFFGLSADGIVGNQTLQAASGWLVLTAQGSWGQQYKPYGSGSGNGESVTYFHMAGFANWMWEFLGPFHPDYVYTTPWEQKLGSDHPGINFGIHCP